MEGDAAFASTVVNGKSRLAVRDDGLAGSMVDGQAVALG